METINYKVKCRSCNKITEMYFSNFNKENMVSAKSWFREHSTFPIEKQCTCDNGSLLLHDVVSMSLNAFI